MNYPFPIESPSFDASYLITEKRLPYHLSSSAIESWKEKNCLHYSIHVALESHEAGIFVLQIVKDDGYAHASISHIDGEARHGYGPEETSFRRGFETLLREEMKRRGGWKV